ncbi:MAG: hypothetical protein HRU26_08815, partial [Psychroserpens sp.]|nr:hypothetical protein [Psychroserpens sp.]
MKKSYCIIIVLLTSLACRAQNDTIQGGYDDVEDLKTQIEENEIVDLQYIDSTFSYRVTVPDWLTLMETNDPMLFGGVFPEVDGVENAILIKGFSKSEFKSFVEFKDIYLTGNKFGQPVKWGSEQTWFGQNDLINITDGVKQKVFIMWGKLIYHNQFILLESGTAFLWIQFTASPETYEKNISKFDEFMSGL